MIYIVGLGPGSKDLLPFKVFKLIDEHDNIYFRTEKHPVIKQLKAEGISFKTFDFLYQEEDSFELVYDKIASLLLEQSLCGPLVYGVPGNPMVAEKSVEKLLALAAEKDIAVEIIPGMSFLEPIYTLLKIDPSKGLQIIDALSMPMHMPTNGSGCIITQVYNRFVASEVKLTLMDIYPDEYEIFVIRAAGVPNEERFEKIPLYELDRLSWIDYLTTVYVPPRGTSKGNCGYPLDPLVDIMELLRGERGCPWDQEQTHESLKRYLIEESYEVLEAIDTKSMHKVCEELGDLLLQIAFHAQIAKEKGYFDINDVIEHICEKLIRRHPHVFASVSVKDSKEVNANWSAIKAAEKQDSGEKQSSLLAGVPVALPVLMRADKIQKKAAIVGFDWPDYKGAWLKTQEELEELKEAIQIGQVSQIEEELGDLLFALVNLARFFNIDTENALTKTILKFMTRFEYIEKEAKKAGISMTDMSLCEMDKLWEQSKISLK